MKPFLFLACFSIAHAQTVNGAMDKAIAAKEIAGSVTLIDDAEKNHHLRANGFADLEQKIPMKHDSIFWIASMTKPVTGTAVMMMQDAGKRYLSEKAVQQMTTVQSGDLVTGFPPGNGWCLGWCVVREPQGVSASLSPGAFGHGGAYGTQAWIDPVKKRVHRLMVQRADFPDSDASKVRRSFHEAASR